MHIETTSSEYGGYLIEFGAYRVKENANDWHGLFRVHKDGRKIHGADVVPGPYEIYGTHAIAQRRAREFAESYVDRLNAKESE